MKKAHVNPAEVQGLIILALRGSSDPRWMQKPLPHADLAIRLKQKNGECNENDKALSRSLDSVLKYVGKIGEARI
jgi:hypothetical protein